MTLSEVYWGYDHLRGVLRQWLRRGEPYLFWVGEAMASHFMEVDVVHHSTVHPSRVGGPRPIWQQCHHYTNTDHNALAQPGTDHTWFGGLLDFYYLTGNRRALEVLGELGRYCAGTRQRVNYDYLTPTVRDAWEDPRQPTGQSPRKAGWALAGMADLYEVQPTPELAAQMRAMVAVFSTWQDEQGRWRTGFGSFSRGAIGFMTAGILTGLQRTWELLGDERAKELCLKGCRFLATGLTNVDGLMYYKEAPINAYGPCFANMDNFRAMAFAWEQTRDAAILRAMWRLFRAWLDQGPRTGHEVKDALWALPVFAKEGLLERWRDGV